MGAEREDSGRAHVRPTREAPGFYDPAVPPDDSLSESWLATRLGVDPRRVDAMRRSGELIALRTPGRQEWRYPAWQFQRGFEPIPGIERVTAAGREAGLDENGLASFLSLKTGMTNGRTLADVLREGRVDHVVEAVRASPRRA
jgi:hypothetical protein